MAQTAEQDFNNDLMPSQPMPFTEAQAKASAVALALGDSAPSPLMGESLARYRLRLLAQFQQYSPRWKNVDLGKLDATALNVVEDCIYADSMSHARDPATVPAGELRAVRERDAVGRTITRWIGAPAACWDAFKGPVQTVVRINARHPQDRTK